LREQLDRLQKIANELNEAIKGLQAEYAWEQQKRLDTIDRPIYDSIGE
jgi:hypothetical protein